MKKGRTRDDKGVIKKKIYDHFKGFTDDEVYVREVDGVCLWDQLEEDYALWLKGEIEMGRRYYELMRAEYRSPCSVRQALGRLPAVADDSQDPVLRDALEAVAEQITNTVSLLDWCDDVESINDCNLVALFAQLLLMPPSKTSTSNTTVGIAVLKMARRLGAHETHQEAWTLMKP